MAGNDSKVKAGTSEALTSYVGPRGEINYVVDTKKLIVHDGVTPGGVSLGLDLEEIKSIESEGTSNTFTLGDVLSKEVISSLIDQEAVTDAVVSANGISKIARQSIGETEVKPGSITTSQVAANTLQGDNIAANTIEGFNIAGRTIEAGELVSGTLTANEIGANQLTSASGIFGDVSVDVLTSGSITSSDIYVGDTNFELDGTASNLTVDDDNGTLRVKLGKVGSNDYGIQIFDGSSNIIFQSSDLLTEINADYISTGTLDGNTVNVINLNADNITSGQINSNRIDVNELSSISADIGSITAGSLNAVTITSSLIRTSSSGTRAVVDDFTNSIKIYDGSNNKIGEFGSGVGGSGVDLDMTGNINCQRITTSGFIDVGGSVTCSGMSATGDIGTTDALEFGSNNQRIVDSSGVVEVQSTGGVKLIANGTDVIVGQASGTNRCRIYVDGAKRTVVRDSNGFLKA